MIYSLSGELVHLDALTSTAVISCAGVGYRVTITTNTLTKLPQDPDKTPRVHLFTHMQVREDAIELFGFYTEEEMAMFRNLISVSGVGPKAAISILSLMTPEKLALAVAEEDVKAISKAPNVGAKTAGRIILDLKGKIAKAYPTLEASGVSAPASVSPAAKSNLADAQEALLVLGYSRQEVNAALKQADPAASVEQIIRAALGALMKP